MRVILKLVFAKRVITLSSNVLFGFNANEIIRQINMQLPNFELKEGYSVKFTGEQDMQAETGNYMVKALFIAVGLILIILVSQFNSISKPLISRLTGRTARGCLEAFWSIHKQSSCWCVSQ